MLKLPASVKCEAMRLARNLVKDVMRKRGYVIGHYDPKDITAAAKALIEHEPSIIQRAEINCRAAGLVP